MTAFEAVFDVDTRNRLVGSLVALLGNRAVAEEIAQEALATGWAQWPRISRFRSPKAWVWRCAFNAAQSERRRRGAEVRALQRAAITPVDEIDHASKLALRACIDELSERQRAAIICRFYSGLSVRETAQVLRCREGTVKALTSQAIDRLRSMDLVEGRATQQPSPDQSVSQMPRAAVAEEQIQDA